MDEKQFLPSLQLIEVSLARGAVKGEEVKVISAMRLHLTRFTKVSRTCLRACRRIS